MENKGESYSADEHKSKKLIKNMEIIVDKKK